jgi:hypothetical protein
MVEHRRHPFGDKMVRSKEPVLFTLLFYQAKVQRQKRKNKQTRKLRSRSLTIEVSDNYFVSCAYCFLCCTPARDPFEMSKTIIEKKEKHRKRRKIAQFEQRTQKLLT